MQYHFTCQTVFDLLANRIRRTLLDAVVNRELDKLEKTGYICFNLQKFTHLVSNDLQKYRIISLTRLSLLSEQPDLDDPVSDAVVDGEFDKLKNWVYMLESSDFTHLIKNGLKIIPYHINYQFLIGH